MQWKRGIFKQDILWGMFTFHYWAIIHPKKRLVGEYLVLVQALFNTMKSWDLVRRRVLGLLLDIYDAAGVVVFQLILWLRWSVV